MKSPEKKVAVSSNALKALERLKGNSSKLLMTQNDLGQGVIEDMEKNERNANNIDKLVTSVYGGYVGVGKEDISNQEINQILFLSNKFSSAKKKDTKRKIEEMKKNISSSNEAFNLIRAKSTSKDTLYKTYGMIIEMIPKMRMSINTIVNGIVSPDDFSKRTFSFHFKNDGSKTTDKKKNVTERIEKLIRNNEIDKNVLQEVEDYLVNGEYAWLVTSINDEIVSLLKESYDQPNDGYETLSNIKVLGETLKVGSIDVETKFLLEEGVSLFKGKKNSSTSYETLLEDLNEFLGDKVAIGDSDKLIRDSYNKETEIQNSRFGSNSKKTNGKGKDINYDGLSIKENKALIKKLDTRNLVKLDYDGKVFGYIYLDSIDSSNSSNVVDMQTGSSNPSTASAQPQNSIVSAINAVVYTANDVSSPDQVKSTAVSQDPKVKFIADFFINRLSDKENLSLLKKNELLKDAIYQSLILRRVTKDERLRVTFLTPDEVVHIDRKKSIFDNVLFFCKMYIATLITILMQNIVRGGDKRAYYVDVGLDNDASNAVNSAIRDIKTKEVSNVHNLDLSSMLNILGETSDYFIPTIGGEKPITIEDVSGLSNVSLDDDFLNWLSNNIFTGIGIPAAFLTEVDNIEFAKALAMQNTRFVRDIVSEQMILGKGYSELIQKAYIKQYGEPSSEEDSNRDFKFLDVKSIEVNFPAPIALNMNGLNDQLSSLNTLIDAVSEVLDVDADNLDVAKLVFKREMFKKYLPNVSWDEIDEITNSIKKDITAKKLKKGKEDSMSDDSSSMADTEDPSVTDASADDSTGY